jgi:hypothetical protein
MFVSAKKSPQFGWTAGDNCRVLELGTTPVREDEPVTIAGGCSLVADGSPAVCNFTALVLGVGQTHVIVRDAESILRLRKHVGAEPRQGDQYVFKFVKLAKSAGGVTGTLLGGLGATDAVPSHSGSVEGANSLSGFVDVEFPDEVFLCGG